MASSSPAAGAGQGSPGAIAELGAPARARRREAARLILISSVAGTAVYACVELGLPTVGIRRGAHELAVFFGFSITPLLTLLLSGRRPGLGGVDRGFAEGAGIYLLFLIPILPLITSRRTHFEGYLMEPAEAALWALLTLIQVTSVDFFTRRVVQLEVERAWGPATGVVAGFAAWSTGHIIEFGWLKELMGPPGALLFLGLTGALTGLVYHRTGNALGLMTGHFLLNVLVAAASAAILGGR